MEIRAITCGSAFSDLREVGDLGVLAKRLKDDFERDSLKVQSLRFSTQYPGEGGKVVEDAVAFEKKFLQVGFNYGSIGLLADEAQILEVVKGTEWVFASLAVAENYEVDKHACLKAARVIKANSLVGSDGFTNLKFSAVANLPANSPFFPGSFHSGKIGFGIGCEFIDVINETVGKAGADEVFEALLSELTLPLKKIELMAKEKAFEAGVEFYGIDVSIAPSPGRKNSIAFAIEKISGEKFGGPGTLAACALLTKVLKSIPVKQCGYSGLMLPVLEDSGLAERNREKAFGINDLLSFSAVCGTGLDTIPLPGDVSVEKLAKIVEDVAVLSSKLKKPLSARLMPIPALREGEMTRYSFSYFENSSVMKA